MTFKAVKLVRMIFSSAQHRIELRIHHHIGRRNIASNRVQGIFLRIRSWAIDWSRSSPVLLNRRYCNGRRGLAAVATLFSVGLGFGSAAAAQPQPRSQLARTYTFDISAQTLAKALNEMSRVSGLSV